MVNICFRVDAGNKVGMGHIMESIPLADSLKRIANCNIVFLMKNFPPAAGILRGKGYGVELLREDIDDKDESREIISQLGRLKSEILIIDLLNKDDEYFKTLKTSTKTLAVILDNAVERSIPADIVINFNITQDEEFYRRLPDTGTTYCIGPRYMLLPEELHSEWQKEKSIPETCRTIFINQGGADPRRLTAKTIRALELLDLKQRIIVVVGPAMSDEHKSELESMRPQLKNSYQFEWSIKSERMHELMSTSDITVTAAGNTLYELALFGVPSIVVSQQEEQSMVAQAFNRRRAIVNLGIGTNITEETIANSVKKLLPDRQKRILLSRNAKRITDGKGSRRVAEIILQSLN